MEIVESWAVTVNFIKQNLRRATKDSITVTKPRENKRERKKKVVFSKGV